MAFQVTKNPRVIKTVWATLTVSSPCPWLSPPLSTDEGNRSPLSILYLFSAKQISSQRNEPVIKILDRLKQMGCQVMAAPSVYILCKRISPLQGTQSNGNFHSRCLHLLGQRKEEIPLCKAYTQAENHRSSSISYCFFPLAIPIEHDVFFIRHQGALCVRYSSLIWSQRADLRCDSSKWKVLQKLSRYRHSLLSSHPCLWIH